MGSGRREGRSREDRERWLASGGRCRSCRGRGAGGGTLRRGPYSSRVREDTGRPASPLKRRRDLTSVFCSHIYCLSGLPKITRINSFKTGRFEYIRHTTFRSTRSRRSSAPEAPSRARSTRPGSSSPGTWPWRSSARPSWPTARSCAAWGCTASRPGRARRAK